MDSFGDLRQLGDAGTKAKDTKIALLPFHYFRCDASFAFLQIGKILPPFYAGDLRHPNLQDPKGTPNDNEEPSHSILPGAVGFKYEPGGWPEVS
jgi:hypothetical protein